MLGPLVSTFHLRPFHRSMRDMGTTDGEEVCPTAQASSGVSDATAWSTLIVGPGLGLATIDHREPSKCSASVLEKVDCEPTAHTSVAELPKPPLRSAFGAFGIWTMFQRQPTGCRSGWIGA